MTHASIPTSYWDDIFTSIVYLINRLPSSSLEPSPYSSLFKRDPDYNFLRVLGCLCFPFTRPYNNHKLQNRSLPCVFIGYALSQKGYKCLHLDTNRVFISCHVIFDETNFSFKNFSSTDASDLDVSAL